MLETNKYISSKIFALNGHTRRQSKKPVVTASYITPPFPVFPQELCVLHLVVSAQLILQIRIGWEHTFIQPFLKGILSVARRYSYRKWWKFLQIEKKRAFSPQHRLAKCCMKRMYFDWWFQKIAAIEWMWMVKVWMGFQHWAGDERRPFHQNESVSDVLRVVWASF